MGRSRYIHQGSEVTTYDPLYLNTDKTEFPDDSCAKLIHSESFSWDMPNSPGKLHQFL